MVTDKMDVFTHTIAPDADIPVSSIWVAEWALETGATPDGNASPYWLTADRFVSFGIPPTRGWGMPSAAQTLAAALRVTEAQRTPDATRNAHGVALVARAYLRPHPDPEPDHRTRTFASAPTDHAQPVDLAYVFVLGSTPVFAYRLVGQRMAYISAMDATDPVYPVAHDAMASMAASGSRPPA